MFLVLFQSESVVSSKQELPVAVSSLQVRKPTVCIW
jgi:hypothetical protein